MAMVGEKKYMNIWHYNSLDIRLKKKTSIYTY